MLWLLYRDHAKNPCREKRVVATRVLRLDTLTPARTLLQEGKKEKGATITFRTIKIQYIYALSEMQ